MPAWCQSPAPACYKSVACTFKHVFLRGETPHLDLCRELLAMHLKGQQALLCCLQLSSTLLRRQRQSERQQQLQRQGQLKLQSRQRMRLRWRGSALLRRQRQRHSERQ